MLQAGVSRGWFNGARRFRINLSSLSRTNALEYFRLQVSVEYVTVIASANCTIQGEREKEKKN